MKSRIRVFTPIILAILLAVLGSSTAAAQQPSATTSPSAVEATHYTVEVLVRHTSEWAKVAADRIREQLGNDPGVHVDYRPPNYVVRVGDFASPSEATVVLERVRELGYVDASITPVESLEAAPDLEGPGTLTDAQRPSEPPAEVAIGPSQPVTPATAPPVEPSRGSGEPASLPGKRIRAARVEDADLAIDGQLDEPAWSSASFSSDFLKKGATRGYPTRYDTEVAVLYDNDALYVGARIHLDTSDIRARKSQRDDVADTDRLIVSLDTYRNRQSAYNFGVTAGGTKIDYYQPRDVYAVRDYTFDPVWSAAAAVNGSGWTAEMRIPFSSLRFHAGGNPPIWGINIERVSPALRLYAFWVVVPADESGWASRFGDLVGLDGVRPHKRLALVPYVATRQERMDSSLAAGPFEDGNQNDWRYGGEFLMDVTPSLSLEATFNPDFGQVEADPSVINLTAYEVFYPEKRPFFIEGSELFQGLGPRYFYSRRVGAPPHGRPNAPFADIPLETTITGAAKLIGRRANGWSVGSLVAMTDQEDASTYDPQTGLYARSPVEPGTLYGVSRLQRDLGAGSTFGVVGTVVSRDFPTQGGLETLLPREAFTGGADWSLRFADQSHEFGGFVGGSVVQGDPAAILRLQGSSARYYQRPDADYVEIDPTRTSLDGYTAGLHVGRIQGTWQWILSGEARSPGFEINDVGAMATADDLSTYGQVSYHVFRPRTTVSWRRFDVSASLASGWNFGSVRQYTSPQIDSRIVWKNFWQTYLQLAYDTSALSDSLTRGGPLMETPTSWRTSLGLSTNDAKQWIWSLNGWQSADDLSGWGYGVSTQALVRFADRFTFSIRPGYDRSRNTRQYYSTLAGSRPEVFNKRYVFATLDQETAYTRLRMGLAITPRLGIDLYMEPFVALGTYDAFGELTRPGTSDLVVYGTGGTTITQLPDGTYQVTDGTASFSLSDGDFDVSSLRGNLVVRWDYALGSTLYFAWAQTRDASDTLGDQIAPGDLADVFGLPQRSIFTVKASFRFDVR